MSYFYLSVLSTCEARDNRWKMTDPSHFWCDDGCHLEILIGLTGNTCVLPGTVILLDRLGLAHPRRKTLVFLSRQIILHSISEFL
jgi:hypothetical protein